MDRRRRSSENGLEDDEDEERRKRNPYFFTERMNTLKKRGMNIIHTSHDHTHTP